MIITVRTQQRYQKILQNEPARKQMLVQSMDCPQCNCVMGAVKGSRDAVCGNCGYKEPCCE